MSAATIFAQVCASNNLPTPVAEFRFHKVRKWRFDFAWPDKMVALEVEGGLFSMGHHARPAGIRRDMEKYNTAAGLGWLVLRCLPETLLKMETLDYIKSAIATRKAA